jgi:cell division protein FtsB
MTYKIASISNEAEDTQNTCIKESLNVGEYELILNRGQVLKYLALKKGKKIKNLLGSDLGIALFEEIKSLREENLKLKQEVEILRKGNEDLNKIQLEDI